MNGLKQHLKSFQKQKHIVFFKVCIDYIKQTDCFHHSEFMFQHLYKWACLPSLWRSLSPTWIHLLAPTTDKRQAPGNLS